MKQIWVYCAKQLVSVHAANYTSYNRNIRKIKNQSNKPLYFNLIQSLCYLFQSFTLHTIGIQLRHYRWQYVHQSSHR